MTDKEIMQQTLNTLENLFWKAEHPGGVAVWRLGGSYEVKEAITALHSRLEQPAAWQGLTDDEIWSVYKQVDSMQYVEFTHAIEAKLKEKNT